MRFHGIAFVVVLFLSLAAPAFAIEPTTISGKNCDFALNTDSGAFACIDSYASTVCFYDSALALKATQKVGSKPVSLIFKKVGGKGYFVVASQKAAEIAIFDAATFKKIRTIALGMARPHMLACSSNSKDPYVYYSERDYYNDNLHRINLLTYEHRVLTKRKGDLFIAVSADGDYLYCARTESSSPEATCYRIEEDGVVILNNDNNLSGKCYPDPFNNYCICRQGVFSADFRVRQKGGMPSKVLGFFPNRPAILCLSAGKNLSLVSYNNFSVLQTMTLPAKFMSSRIDDKTRPSEVPVRCLVDAKRERVLLCRIGQILTLKYSEFQFPAEPLLALRINDGGRRVVAGERNCMKIEPLDEKVEYEIVGAPDGVKLENGQLIWTPSEDQVGIRGIELRLHSGEAQTLVRYEFTVVQPSIALPFRIASQYSFSFDEDGKYAVLINPEGQKSPGDEIVLLDVEKGEIVARRTFPTRVGAIFIDEHYVYFTPAGLPIFYALSKTDLKDVHRRFCNGPVMYLVQNRDGCLIVGTNHGDDIFFYTRPDIRPAMPPIKKPTGDYKRLYRYHISGDRDVRYGDLQNGYFARSGAVYDANNNLTMIFVPEFYRTVRYYTCENGKKIVYPEHLWGRMFGSYYRTLGKASGGSVGRIDCDGAVLLREYPALVSSKYARNGKREKLVFEIRDLITAATKKTLILMEEYRNGHRNEEKSHIIVRNGVAYVLFRDRIYSIRLTAERFSGIKPPLHIEPKVSTQVVSIKGVTRLKYRAIGETGECTFELLQKHEALDLNPKTGELKIDGPGVLKMAFGAIKRSFNYVKFTPETDDLETLVSSRYPDISECYEALLGHKPDGIPLMLPITVIVTDAAKQSSRLTHRLYIVVPFDEVRKLIDEKKAEKPKPRRYYPQDQFSLDRAARERRKKIDQLNERIAELEAEIDRLLKLLDEQGEKDESDGKEQPTQDARKEDEGEAEDAVAPA